MARPSWRGTLSIGLVSIPVEMHVGVREHRPKFRLLCPKDRSPVSYQKVCRSTGKPVAWEDLVKGYEYEKGRFVVLTKEDFETAALEKSKTVDVLDFVDPKDVDPRYYETPYVLAPSSGGDRAYALLREAMREEGKVGIGKLILRESQHLVSIAPLGKALILTTMRYADEIVDVSDLKIPSAPVREKEMKLARALVEGLAEPWNPEKYDDEYRDNLMRVVKAKVAGKKPSLEETVEPRQAAVVDLMERLRESLDAGKRRKSAAAPAARRRRSA
jgi:DNA end-binding protein Ku